MKERSRVQTNVHVDRVISRNHSMTYKLAPDFVTDRKLVKITGRLSLEFLAVDSEGSCADRYSEIYPCFEDF
jgi:hypothetical protein